MIANMPASTKMFKYGLKMKKPNTSVTPKREKKNESWMVRLLIMLQ